MNIIDKWKFCPQCGSHQFKKNSFKSLRCDACGFEYFMNPSSANATFILNSANQLLVIRRKIEPAKGTFDLPGGFADIEEGAEEGALREVKEETGLELNNLQYLFSIPNQYYYSGIDIPTLDLFYEAHISDSSKLQAMDDAEAYYWMNLEDINPNLFGLKSAKEAVTRFLATRKKQ